MDEEPRRLHITTDDLASPEVDRRVEQLRAAQTPTPVRAVGSPAMASAASKRLRYSTVVTSGLAGLVGGLLGWVISEVISRPDSASGPFQNNPAAGTALFTGLFALGLGAAMAGWEGIESRSAKKTGLLLARSLPIVVVGGAIGGFLAQKVIYEPMVKSAVQHIIQTATSQAQALSMLQNALHFPRAIGFGVMGGIVGLSLGAATRSGRRAVNGLAGGIIGGFVGGFLFDYVSVWFGASSGVVPRAIALTLTGLLTGVAIGLVENVRKEFWLEILSGGMAGKQFILYHDQTLVGSGADCHVTLIKDPAIAPHHMLLSRSGRALVASPATVGAPLLINGTDAGGNALRDGDTVQLGTTLLRYGEKQPSAPVVRGIAPGALGR